MCPIMALGLNGRNAHLAWICSEACDKSAALDAIEAIAEGAERGEDVSAHFTNRHVAKQRVNIDFPLDLLRQIDAECTRIGVTRQAWIKMACAERLRQVSSTQPSLGGHAA